MIRASSSGQVRADLAQWSLPAAAGPEAPGPAFQWWQIVTVMLQVRPDGTVKVTIPAGFKWPGRAARRQRRADDCVATAAAAVTGCDGCRGNAARSSATE